MGERIFSPVVMLLGNRYISANSQYTGQVEVLFVVIVDEMYPVRLCFHILPGVSLHDDNGLLVGLTE